MINGYPMIVYAISLFGGVSFTPINCNFPFNLNGRFAIVEFLVDEDECRGALGVLCAASVIQIKIIDWRIGDDRAKAFLDEDRSRSHSLLLENWILEDRKCKLSHSSG